MFSRSFPRVALNESNQSLSEKKCCKGKARIQVCTRGAQDRDGKRVLTYQQLGAEVEAGPEASATCSSRT